MNRAYSALHVKDISEDEEFVYISGIASTPTVDKMFDIVKSEGARFQLPMPLLNQHRHAEPVGHVTFAKPSKKGIPFEARLPVIKEEGTLKDRVDEAIHSLKYKLLAFVSIGFRAIEGQVERLDNGGLLFKEWHWDELSLVTIPANHDAVISSVKSMEESDSLSEEVVQAIKSYDKNASASIGKTKQFTVAKIGKTPGASGKSSKKEVIKLRPKEANMNIQEQIASFKAARDEKVKQMTDVMEKSIEAGETLDEAQSEEYDGLEAEVEAIDKQLERLAKLEKANVATAKEVKDVSGQQDKGTRLHAVAKAKETLEPGIEFARYAMCKLAAKGNPQMAAQLAKTHYPQSERVVKALDYQAQGGNFAGMMKATVEAGTTLDSTWAAPLVDYQNFAGDFVEFLRPQTIIGQFGTGNIPSLNRIPFNVRIAGQTSGGNGYWVGEGAPKPLTQFDFTATELRWNKVAAISVLTNELIRFSDPSAERLVRDGLAGAIIERIDLDFVDPAKAAVANISPASITNGLAPIPATGTGTADDIRADIRALWAPFIAANNAPRTAVYIMDSTTALALSMMQNPLGQSEFPGLTMNGGTFMGVPVVVSDYLPVDSAGHIVILANARDIWLADDGQVTIDASREASLQMDDAPTNNSATGTHTTIVSMFQTNSTAFLAERFINWARRRTSGVAYLSGVNWGE